MQSFEVQITVSASTTYGFEIEAESEFAAEEIARMIAIFLPRLVAEEGYVIDTEDEEVIEIWAAH